jgi:hypothetical protein
MRAYWDGSLLTGWWSGFAPSGLIDPRQLACWASARLATGPRGRLWVCLEGWLGRAGGLAAFQPIRLGNIGNLIFFSKSFINFKSI